ncbi:peptidase M23 [Vibrio sp. HA2012]|uniref:murein hydrolase activator EnvC family protein n=1 Tax=Vibrio sp. HA2012 TaxID=1971595 RepID=UPI000C2C7FB9|nr:peptidoglycan DD-metalloendopeptidase family protein [Vibrio sp. HA2012]PJC85235.1 peptidase M23 [Vibrio sp. HA2012]
MHIFSLISPGFRKKSIPVAGLFCLLFIFPAQGNQEALNGVKNEISRQQSLLSQQKKELDNLQNDLKQQEVSIATLSKDIRQTQDKLNNANTHLKQFRSQQAALQQQQQQQSQTLQDLLKAYYMTKRQNDARSILNPSGEEQDRISQYFQHLAKARTEAIAELTQTEQQLTLKNQQLLAQKQQITALLNQQQQAKKQLTGSQQQRKKTVNKIQNSISSDQQYLAELQRNEVRLKSEIAKAAKRNTVPMDGLERQRGKLLWPVKGKVLHSYGTKQNGQVNWKGMVISTGYEQPVKAVYSGTVVFADYLRGYGMVILLDHGKGDMTLYGYNQTLLKTEGNKVKAGETIALAGDTGGQPQPSLYFEVRRNSKTQNPKQWLQ